MALPLATTTMTVLRAADQTDAYPDADPVFSPVLTGVRAHTFRPRGREEGPLSQRSVTTAFVLLDVVDVRHTDVLRDEHTLTLWQVMTVTVIADQNVGLDHIKCSVRKVEGELQVGRVLV
jgi:hypothetical protein